MSEKEVNVQVSLTQEQAKRLFMLATGAKEENLEGATVGALVENACEAAAVRRYELNEAKQTMSAQRTRIAELEAAIEVITKACASVDRFAGLKEAYAEARAED